jgi:hypothetical protein
VREEHVRAGGAHPPDLRGQSCHAAAAAAVDRLEHVRVVDLQQGDLDEITRRRRRARLGPYAAGQRAGDEQPRREATRGAHATRRG